jgi:hypothetical protein
LAFSQVTRLLTAQVLRLPNVSFQGAGGGQNNVSAGGGQPMEITLNNNVSVSATEVEEVQQTNAMLANNAQI